MGPYKRTQTAAHRQAEFYLPRQALAPQRLIYCGNICYQFLNYPVLSNLRLISIYIAAMAAVDEGEKKYLVYCVSSTAAFLFHIGSINTYINTHPIPTLPCNPILHQSMYMNTMQMPFVVKFDSPPPPSHLSYD